MLWEHVILYTGLLAGGLAACRLAQTLSATPAEAGRLRGRLERFCWTLLYRLSVLLMAASLLMAPPALILIIRDLTI